MGYPYGKTYLEQIQERPQECKEIEHAFYVLRLKYAKDHKYTDTIDLGLKENFQVLGEAFELASDTVGEIADVYHFMWDVIDALLNPEGKDEKETRIDANRTDDSDKED